MSPTANLDSGTSVASCSLLRTEVADREMWIRILRVDVLLKSVVPDDAASLHKILKDHLLHGSRQPVNDPQGNVVSNLNGPVLDLQLTEQILHRLVMELTSTICDEKLDPSLCRHIHQPTHNRLETFLHGNCILPLEWLSKCDPGECINTEKVSVEPLVLAAIIAHVKEICKPEAVLAVGHNVTLDAVTYLLMKLVGLLRPNKAVYIHEPDLKPFFPKNEVELVGRRVAMLMPSCLQ
jgi:hypothetical protein